jgi:HlyD family secretion protein
VKKGLLIGGAVVVVAALVVFNLAKTRDRGTAVEIQKIGRKDLVSIITASGTIDAKKSVNVSAPYIGKVTKLAVQEGDMVKQGDFLLEIDPTEYASAVRSYEAVVKSSQADLTLAQAQQDKADLDLKRAKELFSQQLATQEQLTEAETSQRVAVAQVEAAASRLRQQEAARDKAQYDLKQVTITAPMTGLITRRNVEEGENAIMGTLNNPGTVLLVIADMSTLEARVQVDETEVVKCAIGQPAKIEIDAFPDTSFAGHVTEIGNSPILTGSTTGQQAVDFEVKVMIDDQIPNIRPGLSAKAKIQVAERKDVVAVPIGAVTVRKWPPEERPTRGRRGVKTAKAAAGPAVAAPGDSAAAKEKAKGKEREGVFVVVDGRAEFRLVKLGITGEDDFEVLDGLNPGDSIVTGPFRRLRDLQHGDQVKAEKKKPGTTKKSDDK